MSLLAFGTIALDDIKTDSGFKKDLIGGSATHFSMSSRLFTNVYLAGVIGEDFPKRHINLLKSKGVDLSSVTTIEGKTFHWQGEYKKGDFNKAITLNTELGVLMTYSPVINEKQKNIENIFLANYDPDVQMEFLKLLSNKKFVGLDSMNIWIQHKKPSLLKLIKQVDLFVLNDGEATMLTGETNVVKAAKALRKLGPKLIVIKKGEHGVILYSDQFMFGYPAFPVENVIDPTGAGDTFAGGLMGYLSKVKKINEKTLRTAVQYATICASFNVEGFSLAKTSKLTMADVNKRLAVFKKFISV